MISQENYSVVHHIFSASVFHECSHQSQLLDRAHHSKSLGHTSQMDVVVGIYTLIFVYF